MTDIQLLRQIVNIIGQVLEIDTSRAPDIERAKEPKWNSLKHVEIIFAIEDQFGIQFTEEEMGTLNSGTTITDLIIKYGYEA